MSIRTEDGKGFAEPKIPAGNLVQSRHVADLELRHDVLEWFRQRYGWRPPFSILGYRVRVKPVYEGVTDYGPSKLDEDDHPDDESLVALDHLKFQHDAFPWNAYVDVGSGPVSARIGRQDLSWGETDAFRLLDMIEPLDNRFGFPLIEELDDRKIPLWMARLTSDLSVLSFGPFSNAALDAYFVPGNIEDQETPVAPAASPFSPNVPRPESIGAKGTVTVPEKEFDSSRAGLRLSTGLYNEFTLSLAHYYTWQDFPYPRLIADLSDPTAGIATLDLSFQQVQVSGLSLTGPVPYDPLSILRLETAWFWGEAIPQASDLSNATFLNLITQSAQTGKPATTDIRHSNVLRWMLGLDRNVWIRWLNPQSTFLFSGQYFHTHIFNHSDQTQGLADPSKSDISAFPPALVFDPLYEDEVLFTLSSFTYYWGGRIQPFPIVAYDIRGVWAVAPVVNFFIGTNWLVSLKYVNVTGNWHNLGFFKDRDVAYFKIQYNL